MAFDEIALLIKQAGEAHQAGDKATAIACLQKVVSLDPKHEMAWVMLGGLHSDPQQAITCLQNALAINPNNAQARQGLEWWQKRLLAQPPERQAAREHTARAHQLKSAGQLVTAAEEYRLALAMDASSLEAWLALGLACQELDWPAEAAFAYRQALDLDPHNSPAAQALQRLNAPASRAGTLLWSIDLPESETGAFSADLNGQRLLVSSGGPEASRPGRAPTRPTGRLHLVDRCGNVHTINTAWAIQQAGFSEDGALVYASQAASSGACIAWFDPNSPNKPVAQHIIQGGSPIVCKTPDDVLIASSTVDPVLAISPDGQSLWQHQHGQCNSIMLQPSADRQKVLAIVRSLRAFSSDAELYLLAANGELLWRKTCSNWISSTMLEKGLRVLTASTTSLEASNPKGTTAWQNAYRNVLAIHLSPAQSVSLLQYEQGQALAAIDTWNGNVLWQKSGLPIKSVAFAHVGQPAVVLLHERALLEALDVRHGTTLWQADLSQHGTGAGQLVPGGEGWLAVILGQVLISVGANGKLLGGFRFASSDLSARAAPQPAQPERAQAGLIVTEAKQRLVRLDPSARLVWEQAVPCKDWLAIPRSPYLAALGPKPGGRHSLSMLRAW